MKVTRGDFGGSRGYLLWCLGLSRRPDFPAPSRSASGWRRLGLGESRDREDIRNCCAMPAHRDLVLGTAGHIDHGKTALVRALTGVDTDRLPAEKQRGITIDLGFAALDLGGDRLALVDVPGHERFVRNMLAGATGLDL